MKKKMCIVMMLLSIPLLPVTAAQTKEGEPLSGYADIRAALTAGKALSVVIDFGQCDGVMKMNMKGGATINSFLVLTPGNARSEYLTFSEYHQMLSGEDVTPSVEYIRYKVMQDDTVFLDIHRYSTGNTLKVPPMSYHCKINTAARFYLLNDVSPGKGMVK